MKKLLSIIFIFILSFSLIPQAKATGASLYLSPNSGTFHVGSTFNVSIFVNTGGNDVNAVKVDLKFDPRKLQIASPTAGRSFISVWISQPSYSNTKGTASFQGGAPSPGINTSSGLVSTITFRAITPGETSISFLPSSQVLLNDGKGTNILTSLGRGVYNIAIPPPEGPKVYSSTHPDQNKWYKNNNPTFSWDKEEYATDFSYSIDFDSQGVPDNISEGDHTSVSYSDLDDGIWYFHIKAKKGNVWGGVSHFLVLIDTTPPARFSIVFEPTLETKSPSTTASRQPIVRFITTDALSGLDHYELKIIDLTKALKENKVGFFVEATTPYRLPLLELGGYEIVIRAFDMAGNWQDASKRIEVAVVEKLFYITKEGINILGFLVPWWIIILILFGLLVIILTLMIWIYRRHRRLYKERGRLREIEEKAKRNGEEFRKKLTGI